MKSTKVPHIPIIRKQEYPTLFENAIVEKFGFEFNSDSAQISWKMLDDIRREICDNPYKFYFEAETYENILKTLKTYVEESLSKYALDASDICEKDLLVILNAYNTSEGYLEHVVDKRLKDIQKSKSDKNVELEERE